MEERTKKAKKQKRGRYRVRCIFAYCDRVDTEMDGKPVHLGKNRAKILQTKGQWKRESDMNPQELLRWQKVLSAKRVVACPEHLSAEGREKREQRPQQPFDVEHFLRHNEKPRRINAYAQRAGPSLAETYEASDAEHDNVPASPCPSSFAYVGTQTERSTVDVEVNTGERRWMCMSWDTRPNTWFIKNTGLPRKTVDALIELLDAAGMSQTWSANGAGSKVGCNPCHILLACVVLCVLMVQAKPYLVWATPLVWLAVNVVSRSNFARADENMAGAADGGHL